MDPSLLRRSFLKRSSIGSAALMSLLKDSSAGIIKPNKSAKCKRVIVLCMAGGPSHLETFDYKPKLEELDGKDLNRFTARLTVGFTALTKVHAPD